MGDPPEVLGRPAGDAHGRIVLLGAAQRIGKALGDREAIDLGGGEILLGPTAAAGHRYAGAAIIGDDHSRRVGGIQPQIMHVAVPGAHRRESLAGICGAFELEAEHMHRVAIARVGPHAQEIETALPQLAVGVDVGPGPPGIV